MAVVLILSEAMESLMSLSGLPVLSIRASIQVMDG